MVATINCGYVKSAKLTNGTDRPNSTWRYYWWPHHCVIGDGLLCVEWPSENEQLAVGLFIAGAVIVVVLVVVVVVAGH